MTRPMFLARLEDRYGAPPKLDQGAVYGWEVRAHEPCERAAVALSRYFRVESIAELGLGREPAADAHWTLMTKAERRAEVDRRKALRRGVGLVVGVLPVGPLVQAAKLFGDRRRVDPEMLDLSEQTATHLAVTYLASPAGPAGPAALAHARSLAKLLAGARMTEASRTRLAGIASDAAALVGHTHLSDGRVAQAHAWFGDAVALAREAGDRRLEALVMASTAGDQSGPPGSRDRLAAVQAAAGLGRFLPAAGRAYVSGYLSWELSAAADDVGSGRALEQAREASARAGREDPGWGYWSQHGQLSGWDGARAQVFTGLRPLYLGRHREAVPILERALDGTVVRVRRVFLRADLMRAWTGVADPERACAEGMAVLDEAESRDIGHVEVRDVRATFPPGWDALACVIELDERLAAPDASVMERDSYFT
ncbi:MAG: hypothetical protein ACRDYA_09200 [Egibacteraceae bacterium]